MNCRNVDDIKGTKNTSQQSAEVSISASHTTLEFNSI